MAVFIFMFVLSAYLLTGIVNNCISIYNAVKKKDDSGNKKKLV